MQVARVVRKNGHGQSRIVTEYLESVQHAGACGTADGETWAARGRYCADGSHVEFVDKVEALCSTPTADAIGPGKDEEPGGVVATNGNRSSAMDSGSDKCTELRKIPGVTMKHLEGR